MTMLLLKFLKAVMAIGRFTRKTLATATSEPLVEIIEIMIEIHDLTEMIGITVRMGITIIFHQAVCIEITDLQQIKPHEVITLM